MPGHAHGMHGVHGLSSCGVGVGGGAVPERRARGAMAGLQLPGPDLLPLRTIPSPPEAPKTLPNEPFVDSMG